MVLPGSFRRRYDELEPDLETARDYVKDRLHAEMADVEPVDISVRVKDAESVLAKLQRGEIRTLWEMDDLVGARVVVLHPKQVTQALELAQISFALKEARNLEVGRPTELRYQQPHLIVGLPGDYLDRHAELAELRVELQFTTYVQHALQESTHDIIYKGTKFSWREHRLDAQLRGVLEVVDGALENLQYMAAVEEEPKYLDFDTRNEIIQVCQEHFAKEELPKDLRRLAITVERHCQAAQVSPEQLGELLGADAGELTQARSLTVVEKIFGVLLNAKGDVRWPG
jgi:ppGpp synthetase/RelA/SpoT-type nucleotidyltranferase